MGAPTPPAAAAAAGRASSPAAAAAAAGGPPEIRVLEVDAYASVQDLIHAAILSNRGAAALKEVRRSGAAVVQERSAHRVPPRIQCESMPSTAGWLLQCAAHLLRPLPLASNQLQLESPPPACPWVKRTAAPACSTTPTYYQAKLAMLCLPVLHPYPRSTQCASRTAASPTSGRAAPA